MIKHLWGLFTRLHQTQTKKLYIAPAVLIVLGILVFVSLTYYSPKDQGKTRVNSSTTSKEDKTAQEKEEVAGSKQTETTPTPSNTPSDKDTTPINTPTPPVDSNTGGTNETPKQPTVVAQKEFDVELSVVGLVDGDPNCRETKVTSNKTITDYTYISGSEVSGGGSPQSSAFIFGICKKAGVYDYYLTLYSSDGDKKVIHEFFSSWPSVDNFPTPTPTEIPEHDPFEASWNVQTLHTGTLKELACDSGGCFESDEYQEATITANLQLKSCHFKTDGYSSPNGTISISTGNSEGEVEDSVCTYTTGVGYTIRGAKIESIYGETMTFGDW